MPCYDPRDHMEAYRLADQIDELRRKNTDLLGKLNTRTDQLCRACKIMEAKGITMDSDIAEWWEEHKKIDEQRKLDKF